MNFIKSITSRNSILAIISLSLIWLCYLYQGFKINESHIPHIIISVMFGFGIFVACLLIWDRVKIINKLDQSKKLLKDASAFMDVTRFNLGEEFDPNDIEGKINNFLEKN